MSKEWIGRREFLAKSLAMGASLSGVSCSRSEEEDIDTGNLEGAEILPSNRRSSRTMISQEQFEKAKHFIFRHGRLLDRKRFGYYFENGSKDALMAVLACAPHDDDGLANGPELDIMCPQSSGTCMETALNYLVELDVRKGEMLDRAEQWILRTQSREGFLPHPADHLVKYPHAPHWKDPNMEGWINQRPFAIAGLLSQLERGSEEFYSRVAALFEKAQVPLSDEIGEYRFPGLHCYLRFSRGADRFANELAKLEAAAPAESDIARDVSMLQDDGGVSLGRHAHLPWWRPQMTLDLLVKLKKRQDFPHFSLGYVNPRSNRPGMSGCAESGCVADAKANVWLWRPARIFLTPSAMA